MSQEGVLSDDINTSLNTPEPQSNIPGKTPIQILQEYGIKIGRLPAYVMDKSGEAHLPSFVCTLSIGDVRCTGQGTSQKAAKHQAAEAALKILRTNPVNSESNGVAPETTNQPNAVGMLQELTLQRGWRPPEYPCSEAGPPHAREFTVTCRIESWSVEAVGNSKKTAKKAAAEKMVAKLQDASLVGEQSVTPPHTLSGSNAEASNCVQMSSDTSGWLPSQENKTSPAKQTSQTTNTNSEVLGVYPMTAARRGICLIINNYNFSQCNVKKREGTFMDEKCLQEVFGWLGFAIEIWRDCTSEEMLSVLRELGSRDHSRRDCVVCCILSHGLEGAVQGVDGNKVKLKNLMESLNAVNCPSLAEKPKLFFIQACQGSDTQKAVHIEEDGPECSRLCSDAVTGKNSIPCDADFLQAMATVPFFVSYRDKRSGSWFIQSLCQHLVQMVPREVDLMSILTQVNADVSQKTDDTGAKKQMPQPAFSLRKRVVFPNPKGDPPSLRSLIPEEKK